MMTRANALAVMAKAPLAGKVKTRMQPFLSAAQAAELARALICDQLRHLIGLEDADLYFAYAPANAASMIRRLAPKRFSLFPQHGGDLGARMHNVFVQLTAQGYKKMILIGGDLPPVPLAIIEEGFSTLDRPDAALVLGPSRDGGYYLVGMKDLQPAIFSGIAWGGTEVLAATLAKAATLSIDTCLLPPWFDVDTPEDLDYLLAKIDPALRSVLPSTLDFLERIELEKSS